MNNFIIILLILLFNCNALPNNTIIKIRNKEMIKNVGNEFDIKVRIQGATNIIGLSTWITYDPNIVEVVDSDDQTLGTQIITIYHDFFNNSTLLVSIQKDAQNEVIPGTLIIGYSDLQASPMSGDGNMFSIKFKAIAPGSTIIDFSVTNRSLEDLKGPIPAEWNIDNLDVNALAQIFLEIQ